MSVVGAHMTADEFLDIEKNGLELVDGVVSEEPSGTMSAIVGAWVATCLGVFVAEHKLGLVLGSEAMYRIWPDRPNHIRKPDISFIARELTG